MRQGFQWPYTLSPYDTGMLIEDVWPTLFFGVERLEEIRRKVDCLPWAKDVLSQMRAEAEVVVTQPPLLPESKIGWRHDFYSHTSAEHLVYDPESPGQFLDPLDQSWHTSQAQREAWVLLTHERTFRMMRSLGVLYGITGDERFAAWVADGVKRAARFFMRADLREGNRFNALYFHPLYDSQTLMLLANAYSLTRDSGFYSVADQEAVATNIFENGMPSQMRFLDETGAHNMTAYVAASLVLAGTVLGREDWRKRGLYDSQGGVPALLRDGLRTDRNGQVDGFWFEGTMFYHFYTICPMVAAFEGLKADGTPDADLFERFEKMFEAPVLLCDQELRLPCLGDLGSPGARSLSVYRHLYEYAAGQFESDLYERALSEIYGRGVSRNSLSALAYGPDEVRPKRLSRRSTVLKASGVAMFRGKTKEGSFDLMFRSGPHGAGHNHRQFCRGAQCKGEMAWQANY